MSAALRARLVQYAELRPCSNAFIDARTPGSDSKENFTIIGPGVAENPHQYVHIREPHGFNIGGARQPPRCTNSLHSHDTAEVFMIHRGKWRFFWGEHGDAGSIELSPGDTISIPIHIFRGFENVGEEVGFMFAVLGGDHPGRVHWAPHVIAKAQGHGLMLLDNGNLIDTTVGETAPPGATVVTPSAAADLAYIRVPTSAEMRSRVVRRDQLLSTAHTDLTTGAHRQATALVESPIIGSPSPLDGVGVAPIVDAHGFTLRYLVLEAGSSTPMHSRECVEVLLMQSGRAVWMNDQGESVVLVAGDSFSVPIGMHRQLQAVEPTELFVVRGGDTPGPVFYQ